MKCKETRHTDVERTDVGINVPLYGVEFASHARCIAQAADTIEPCVCVCVCVHYTTRTNGHKAHTQEFVNARSS